QTVVLLQTIMGELNTGATGGGANRRTRDRLAVDRVSIQLVAHDLADRDDVRVNRTDNPGLGSDRAGTNVLGADGAVLDESGASSLPDRDLTNVDISGRRIGVIGEIESEPRGDCPGVGSDCELLSANLDPLTSREGPLSTASEAPAVRPL